MRQNRPPITITSGCGVSAPIGTITWAADHSVNLTGLAPETTYHFRVMSVDANGNEAVSSDQVFTTTSVDTVGQLSVHFMAVGNGDAIILEHVTNHGTDSMLIDGGDGSSDIVPYIKNHVDEKIGTVVATHPHEDHIGGLIDVLDAFEVQQIWYNGDALSTETYNDFMNAVHVAEAEVHVARQGGEIPVGDLRFRVLNPSDISGTTNNNSIVLALNYGQIYFLFEGDADQEAEARMLDAGLISPTDVLKVGHHGSKTGSSRDFLAEARPKIAVCMAGAGNRYGHPHAETISALHAVGAKTYITGIHGTTNVTTDGRKCTVATSGQATALMLLENGDATAPGISHITVADITSSAATITWTTDEPATSQVEYGLTTSYGSSTEVNSSLLTSHGVSLGGPAQGCTYHFRA